MKDAQNPQPDAQPLASTSTCPSPTRTHATERPRRKRHLGSGMLALLCGSTAGAIDDPMSPIERSKRASPSSPTISKGSVEEKDGEMSATAECTSLNPPKSKPARLPLRRPSVKQRIQSLSRISDRALSSAASSFLRRGSATSGKVPSMPTSHSRGASISSFTSGKSSGSGSSKPIIGSPSAFKHQFHLGPDPQRSSPWDESRWRQIVEMRTEEEPEIIDVSSSVSNGSSDPVSSQPRASTSSDRCGPAAELSSSPSKSKTHARSVSHSQTQSQDDDFAAFAAKMASATASSPNLLVSGNGSSANLLGEDGKTPKHLKRSSLVKRKPVPPLYPDEPSPALSQPVLAASASTAPATKTEFHLMPDPPADPNARPFSPIAQIEKADDKSEDPSPRNESPFPPEHIDVSRPTSPAPTVPPRRHTLAHTTSIRSRKPLSNLPAKRTPASSVDTVAASVNEDTPTETSGIAALSVATETVIEEPSTAQDASPKPSFSSLTSASASDSESSPEPRTPTDDRRVSAGSAASIAVLIVGQETPTKVRDDVDEDEDEDRELVSPAKLRSPPARRSPVDEETMYVTADEAETEAE